MTVLQFALHPGYIPPERTAQRRDRFSKQLRRLLPGVAGVAQSQNRPASFAEQPHNLIEFQVCVDLMSPCSIDGPVG